MLCSHCWRSGALPLTLTLTLTITLTLTLTPTLTVTVTVTLTVTVTVTVTLTLTVTLTWRGGAPSHVRRLVVALLVNSPPARGGLEQPSYGG